MFFISHLIVTMLLANLIAVPAHAADSNDLAVGLKIYSAMSYIKEENEYYGLQIVVIPFHNGRKVLWRSGNGRLDQPLLLDLTQDGNNMKVTVPEGSDDYGEWTLSLKGKVLRAQGPRDLHFDLREISQLKK